MLSAGSLLPLRQHDLHLCGSRDGLELLRRRTDVSVSSPDGWRRLLLRSGTTAGMRVRMWFGHSTDLHMQRSPLGLRTRRLLVNSGGISVNQTRFLLVLLGLMVGCGTSPGT